MPINLKNLENQLNKIDTLKESLSLSEIANKNEPSQLKKDNINYNLQKEPKIAELFKVIYNYLVIYYIIQIVNEEI
jgi:hypothetical protein